MSDWQLICAQNPVLENARIRLRPITLADAPAMFEYMSDPAMLRHMTLPVHQTLAESEKNIASYFMATPLAKYGIEILATNQFAGTIDLHFIDEESMQAEVGYLLHPKFQGNGYMTEAGSLLLQFAFEVIGFERISARCDSENSASEAVMQRLGMQFEGVQRSSVRYADGRFVDLKHYAILKEDYRKL